MIDISPLYKKALEFYDLPSGNRCRHYTYILRRNKIVSFGWNKLKTSSFAARLKYKYPYIHSELDAIRNFPWPLSELSKCKVINLRIGESDRRLMMCKPCEYCEAMLLHFGAGEIWYIDKKGELVCL